MSALTHQLSELIVRGGPVMYPLLALSVLSLALILERSWFWMRAHRPARLKRLGRIAETLRSGEMDVARDLASDDAGHHARFVRQLIRSGASDAAAVEAVESHRPVFERFMVTLSTIITAAPMLGILGTVTGIIKSFNLLSDQRTLTDPTAVSAGIAEALITTAFGLVVAVVTLFPYMIFRGQVERAIGRMESLIAAAQQGEKVARSRSTEPPPATAGSATVGRREGVEAGRQAVTMKTT